MRLKDFVKEQGGTMSDLFNLPLSVLDPNPDNIRLDTQAVREHIQGIADSIRETGFLRSRPLTVRLVGDRAIVVDGNCRLMACRIAVEQGAELLTVPCVPEAVGTSPVERLANMLVANAGLAHSPFEKVGAIKLMMSYGWTDTQIAKRLGVSRQTIQNLLELAGTSPEVQEAVAKGTVSATQARQLTREHGSDAGAVIARVVEASGKQRVTARAFKTPEPKRITETPAMGLLGAAREILRIWDGGDLGPDFDQAIECLRAVVS